MKYPFLVIYLLSWSLVLPSAAGCQKKNTEANTTTTTISFAQVPAATPVAPMVPEASGIADSKINPGYLWVEEDSGNPPQLFLLGHTGKVLKTIYIKGATNRDWEDIALAAGPEAAKNYLYVAEIGDNNARHSSSAFYRFEEPAAATDTVRRFDLISFSYADGPRDAEAFLVDEAGKDIFIISKRDNYSRIYKLAYPYSTTVLNTAEYMASLPYNGVVSAAQSPDGKGLIVKTYTALYYYSKKPGQSIPATLQTGYTALQYQLEPQGEAIGFAADNSGFFTLSEKGNSDAQPLYFYKKN